MSSGRFHRRCSSRSARSAARPLHARRSSRLNDATVVALSVVPNRATSGRADVVIRVDGQVTLKHFTLSKPDKIVVDISGRDARLARGRCLRWRGTRRHHARPLLAIHEDGRTRRAHARCGAYLYSDAATPASPRQRRRRRRQVRALAGRPRRDRGAPRAARAAGGAGGPRRRSRSEKTQAVEKPQPAEKRQPVEVSEPAATCIPASLATSKAAPFKQSQEPRITGISWDKAPINDVISMFAVVHRPHDSSFEERHGHRHGDDHQPAVGRGAREIMNANGYDVTVNPDGVIVIDTFENIAARQATTPLLTRNID